MVGAPTPGVVLPVLHSFPKQALRQHLLQPGATEARPISDREKGSGSCHFGQEDECQHQRLSHRGIYSSPCLVAELRAQGIVCGRRRYQSE
ncbi:MAG TPA: hypothetical protein VFV38_19585 [Ktedonobacteraceae bacterium]|nr:hypothetical protein [Ktedonobacteraceae bacterium]